MSSPEKTLSEFIKDLSQEDFSALSNGIGLSVFDLKTSASIMIEKTEKTPEVLIPQKKQHIEFKPEPKQSSTYWIVSLFLWHMVDLIFFSSLCLVAMTTAYYLSWHQWPFPSSSIKNFIEHKNIFIMILSFYFLYFIYGFFFWVFSGTTFGFYFFRKKINTLRT